MSGFFDLISNPAKADRLLKAFLVIPNLGPLVAAAEDTFTGKGRGKEKKAFVLRSMKFMTKALEKKGYVSPEMIDGLDKVAEDLIDTIVDFNNHLATDEVATAKPKRSG